MVELLRRCGGPPQIKICDDHSFRSISLKPEDWDFIYSCEFSQISSQMSALVKGEAGKTLNGFGTSRQSEVVNILGPLHYFFP